mmetsp:Transcript_3798/g.7833  ORF Transcript_3798/g.7833 Transcript_3798/m.7833 type:complete len:375 (-) Transcript_3798:60-1184(-)|eukprot:CAMPEP_0118927628 /NCGR_PEP_ID=MMETSP1169-20130426/5061_1 /TAXON_ID=36882 /ORGANISM="Pyramimonas obovata, Strain CCMP722" /LENGTH=374 /DNA_ID=CAMNT_0006869433 /DNA_START=64 /DNA_END=1188 /DNA_ORIENTATION=+
MGTLLPQLCALLSLLALGAQPTSCYTPSAPVIGVLTYPSKTTDAVVRECRKSKHHTCLRSVRVAEKAMGPESSYIESGYVRWLEAAGARVVPIPYDAAPSVVQGLFERVNGVLLTGGPAKPLEAPAPYFATATLLYRLVEEAWARGEVVPLWGTCLGLQTVACIAAGGADVLGDFLLYDFAMPLDFAPAAAASRLFGRAGDALRRDFRANVTTNWHSYGISPERLPASLTALATNVDLKGGTFVSALEGAGGLPVYAVQFHPESVQFEPQDAAQRVPAKTAAAVRTNQYLGRFVAEEARRNAHAFASAREESRALVQQMGTLHPFQHANQSDNSDTLLYPENGSYVFPPAARGIPQLQLRGGKVLDADIITSVL